MKTCTLKVKKGDEIITLHPKNEAQMGRWKHKYLRRGYEIIEESVK